MSNNISDYDKLVSILPWVTPPAPTADFSGIFKHATKKLIPSGNIISSQGDIAQKVYYVNKGTVKVSSITNDGKEKIYMFQSAGTFVGIVALYHTYPSNAFDIAVEDCELFTFDILTFKELLSNNVVLHETVMHTFAKIIRILIGELHSITFKTAEQRVCGLVYLLAAKYGKQTKTGIFINIKMRHEDIANIYSLHRVTVTKIFQHLHDIKIIQKQNNTSITVLNMQKLYDLALFEIN